MAMLLSNDDYPPVEEFDNDELKLLFMLLAENRGRLDLAGPLAPHGKYLLSSVQRKLGIMVVGVATTLGERPRIDPCPTCDEGKLWLKLED